MEYNRLKTTDRDTSLDALRGAAFIAVILVNLVTEFRVPFLLYLEKFHTSDGLLNHATDWVVGVGLEGKGLAILATLFGMSVAIMAEKYSSPSWLLFRRFIFLLAIGIFHITVIFSGDILTLYALCGFLLIPLVRIRTPAIVAILIITSLFRTIMTWPHLPIGTSSASLIDGAYTAYGQGSFIDILEYRLFEIKHLIGPLLLSVWPRVFSFMLFGILVWRQNWINYLKQEGKGFRIGILALLFGGLFTTFDVWVAMGKINLGRWSTLNGDLGIAGLALGYSTLVLRLSVKSLFVRLMAAVGRMSLSVYISQTILLGFIFYSYGLARFGKLGSFSAALIGICFYIFQILIAQIYFTRFKQGPLEWLWKRITHP